MINFEAIPSFISNKSPLTFIWSSLKCWYHGSSSIVPSSKIWKLWFRIKLFLYSLFLFVFIFQHLFACTRFSINQLEQRIHVNTLMIPCKYGIGFQKFLWAHKSSTSSIFTSQQTTLILCGISKGIFKFLQHIFKSSEIYQLVSLFEMLPRALIHNKTECTTHPVIMRVIIDPSKLSNHFEILHIAWH